MGEEGTIEKKKSHRVRLTGRKAEKKKSKKDARNPVEELTGKQRNPKAFAINSAIRAERKFRRKQDIETKKQHIPLVDRTPIEPPPILIAVVGPPKVGKTTLINNLIKLFTKSPLTDIKGPVTIVTGKKRRVTLIECNNDITSMIDLAKVCDLALLLCDASFGFEMEVFEFLNICQVHGMPRIMGILTHLDMIKNSKTLKTTKKTLKHRFWTEVYNGAKLFYLSGIIHGEYLRNEIKNLGRFISVMKFRPLIWRQTHSYLLGDRYEDLTNQELVRKNINCDRTISLYGYIRGVPLKKENSIHVAGLGDLRIHDISYLPDPCPLPEELKKRALIEKEKFIYAPFSGVGGIVYDKDAVYVELGGSHSHSKRDEGDESNNIVANLIETKETLDVKMEHSELQLFTGGKKLTAKDFEASENSPIETDEKIILLEKKDKDQNGEYADLDAELNQLRAKTYNEESVEDSGRIRRRVIFDTNDTELVDNVDSEAEQSSSEDESIPDNLNLEAVKRKIHLDMAAKQTSKAKKNDDIRSKIINVLSELRSNKSVLKTKSDNKSSESQVSDNESSFISKAASNRATSEESDSSESESENEQETPSKLKKIITITNKVKDKKTKTGSNSDSSESDSDMDDFDGNNRGSGSDSDGISDEDSKENPNTKNNKNEDGQTLSEGDSASEDDEDMALKWKDNLAKKAQDAFLDRVGASQNLMKLVYGVFDSKYQKELVEAENQDESENEVDISGLLKKVSQDQQKLKLAKDNMNLTESSLMFPWNTVTKDWTEEESKSLIVNCFVTGKWKDSEDASELLRLDDAENLSDVDSEVYGDFEDLETGKKHATSKTDTTPVSKSEPGQKRKRDGKGLDEKADREALAEKKRKLKEKFDAEYDNPDKNSYYDELKMTAEKQAQLNKTVFENMPDDVRVQVEGFRPGMYVRIEFENVPAEFIQHFDPSYPLVIGSLNMGEENIGFVNVKIKKHRWYSKILKTSDPLIISLGWRRFQTIPLYSKLEDDLKYRYLKYTPEHLACNAHFWGPITPQGTGFLALQSVDSNPEILKKQGFRIAATGSVQELDKSTQIMKKLKLVGTPLKIYKKTAFIKGMFNSSLEVAKFEGARIKTVSGIRGQIKKAINKPEGCFRATFEDKILLSDIVFCRTWYKVDVPEFYNPVTTLLLPPDKKNQWVGVRTTGEIKREKNIRNPVNKDSLYTPVIREDKPFKPLIVPAKLQKALPYRDKPNHGVKNAEKKKMIDRVAVIREPHEQKISNMIKMIKVSYQHKQEKLKQETKDRLEKHRQTVAAHEASKERKIKEKKKEVFRKKSKALLSQESRERKADK